MSESKILVVTGGSRGIGAATARLAAASGWCVCIAYLSRRDAADRIVSDISSKGGRAIAVQADISSEVSVVELFRKVDRELGGATALVNRACDIEVGIRLPGPPSSPRICR